VGETGGDGDQLGVGGEGEDGEEKWAEDRHELIMRFGAGVCGGEKQVPPLLKLRVGMEERRAGVVAAVTALVWAAVMSAAGTTVARAAYSARC